MNFKSTEQKSHLKETKEEKEKNRRNKIKEQKTISIAYN